MGVLSKMCEKGDLEIKWSATRRAEVEHAREAFDSAKKQGFLAYEVRINGKKVLIQEFDENAEHIVMTPARVGG